MGIAFVVLFVVGFLALPTPDSNKASQTAKWEAWWTDSGHRTAAIIGAYLMVLGLLAFVWFAWNLRQRVQGGDRVGNLGGLMVTFAGIFAAMGMLSALIRVSIAGSKTFGDTPVPTGEFARQFDQVGFGFLLVAGALCAGMFVGLASHLARRSGALPGWLTTAGFVVAVLQLVASIFFPFILFVLWVLIASILLVRRGSAALAPS
jgi:hypothetical protein